MSNGPRVLLVCGPGADLQQLLMLAPAWHELEHRWVTPRAADTEHQLAGEAVTYVNGPTGGGLVMLGRNARLARGVLRDFTPDVVLGTGAALALPFLLGARLRGRRAVFVESVTRVDELSPTGRLVYPFASAVFVQSATLQARRPRARYTGSREPARSAAQPLTEAVGRALREAPDRGRGRIANLVSGTLGAYLEIGTDFHPQPPGRRVDPNGLAGYYCDFTHKADPSLQADGIWLAEALSGAPWWSPMMVSQAALGFWERHLAGEDTLDRFIALADWLIRYGERDERGVGWGHDLAVPKYGVSPGWRSGMTQGEAISVLLRAHAATGEDRYRETAAAAFEPFTTDVAAGGVVRMLDGALVIEEYPTARPTAVLNGWIFGLLGLHELALVDDRSVVSETLARTQAGLLTLLPRYDVGWWSRYSLGDYGRPDLAKPFYQRLHVVLLDAVDLIAPDPLLRATARRWEGQIKSVAMGRIAIDKVRFRALRALR